MQNTIRIAAALGYQGKAEERIANVRALFTNNRIPTEFKKGEAIVIDGKSLTDKDGNIGGACVRAAAAELGYDLKVTAEWVEA